jgi:hypothetical protein
MSASQRAVLRTGASASNRAVPRAVPTNVTNRNGRSSRKRKTVHKKGHLHPNTIVSRLPNGMPIQTRPNSDVRNYLLGHRLGSRVRTETQRFLQRGRQRRRRNPALAALSVATSRGFNETNQDNVKSALRGWVEAEDPVSVPHQGYWGAVGVPMVEAVSLGEPTQVQPVVGSESNLFLPWLPVAAAARRPMTQAEMNKEDRFRQRAAEEAQRRARAIYRSPKDISRKSRKVKSLSIKREHKNRTKRSF